MTVRNQDITNQYITNQYITNQDTANQDTANQYITNQDIKDIYDVYEDIKPYKEKNGTLGQIYKSATEIFQRLGNMTYHHEAREAFHRLANLRMQAIHTHNLFGTNGITIENNSTPSNKP